MLEKSGGRGKIREKEMLKTTRKIDIREKILQIHDDDKLCISPSQRQFKVPRRRVAIACVFGVT